MPKRMRKLMSMIEDHSEEMFTDGEIKGSELANAVEVGSGVILLKAVERFERAHCSESSYPEGASEEFLKEAKDLLKDKKEKVRLKGELLYRIRLDVRDFQNFTKPYCTGRPRLLADINWARCLLIELEIAKPGLMASIGLDNKKYGLVINKTPGVPKPRKKKVAMVQEFFVPASQWETPNLLVEALFGKETILVEKAK